MLNEQEILIDFYNDCVKKHNKGELNLALIKEVDNANFIAYLDRVINIISSNKTDVLMLNDYFCACLYYNFKDIVAFNVIICNYISKKFKE